MAKRYLLIDPRGVAVNALLMAEDSDWPVPEGFSLVQSDSGAIGGRYMQGVEEPVRLVDLRNGRLAAINAERDRREEAGFPYRGKTLDSTPRSVQRLTAAALAAQAALATGQPFTIDWTCADNSVLPLDAAGVIGMPVALAQHAAALHAHARTLKTAAVAAVDQAELDAIDITTGWPGDTA